jgi:hypothetical protein
MTDSSQPPDPTRIPLTASSPVPIGRHAEPRVVAIVNRLLTASDHTITELPSRDAHGEDACLAIDGQACTVQVTGIPQAPTFWRRVVTEGSATTSATLQELSGWLSDAIHTKVDAIEPAQRANTVIALDAHRWADQVVQPAVISNMSSSGLNPAQNLGLGGIAIVGASTSDSTWVPGRIR